MYQFPVLVFLLLAFNQLNATALEDAESLVFKWFTSEPPANIAAFYADVSVLSKSAQQSADAAESLQLVRDKLKYFRAQLEKEEIQQEGLWPVAEELAGRKREAINAGQSYRMELESVSRKWGGDHWWLLMDLLAEYVSASRPLPD